MLGIFMRKPDQKAKCLRARVANVVGIPTGTNVIDPDLIANVACSPDADRIPIVPSPSRQ